ncbi:hypothetical protein E2C01_083455 [Portunus trituberculatus]|uniref:Uncharacterized protein n=1 Tax=Portunus trituberculatus TaxID=210409 RepID=A0A5B7J4Q6_PORTR|nr:hypothetical protein [Portunus trituberculatus]
MSFKIQLSVLYWERLSPPQSVAFRQRLPSPPYHRHSTFLVQTYTKLASFPRCHALHSLLLRHSKEPLYGSLLYQAHTPFVDRAISFFATLWMTPLPFLILEKNFSSRSLISSLFLSLSVPLHIHTVVQSWLPSAEQDPIHLSPTHTVPQPLPHLHQQLPPH